MESAKPVARVVRMKGRVAEIGLKRRKHIVTLVVNAEDVTELARAGAFNAEVDVEFSIPLVAAEVPDAG